MSHYRVYHRERSGALQTPSNAGTPDECEGHPEVSVAEARDTDLRGRMALLDEYDLHELAHYGRSRAERQAATRELEMRYGPGAADTIRVRISVPLDRERHWDISDAERGDAPTGYRRATMYLSRKNLDALLREAGLNADSELIAWRRRFAWKDRRSS